MAKNNIKISPKHGLNPCIPICFFCGKEKNEIALLGKLKNDEKAPRTAVLDYEPCDDCKEHMQQGITVIETVHVWETNNGVPICEDLVPTGNWSVLRDTCELFDAAPNKDSIMKSRRCIMDSETYQAIFSETNQKD